MANGRGICIYESEDFIRVDNANGGEECVPWTLQTYIKLSSGRYASRTRLYCVQKLILIVIDSEDVPTVEELRTAGPMITEGDEEAGHSRDPTDVEESWRKLVTWRG